MDVLGQSALILGMTSFSLAITGLTRNMRNKLIVTFAIACAVISGWSLSFFISRTFEIPMLYRLHLTFHALLTPAIISFARVFVRMESRFLRTVQHIALLYAGVVIMMQWTGIHAHLVPRALAFYGPTLVVVMSIYLLKRDWDALRVRAAQHKAPATIWEQGWWINTGALALVLTATMDHTPIMGTVVPSVANFLAAVYLFLLSEIVIHQRLLNVFTLLTRVLAWMLMIVFMTIVYVLAVAWGRDKISLFILNSVFASFMVMAIFDPIRRVGGMIGPRLFRRRTMMIEEKIDAARRKLVGTLDVEGLARLTSEFIQDALECQSASVFILATGGAKFKRAWGVGDQDIETREVLSNNPVIEFFTSIRRRSDSSVLLDQFVQVEIDRAISRTQRQHYEQILTSMQGLGANIVIPFLGDSTVLGFVAIRAENPPELWGDNWGILTLFSPFFSQAARTLQSMDVYVQLREKDRLAALGEMAAGLAHEIRNPLGAIKGASQILQTQADRFQGSESDFLKVIVEEVDRLNRVVAQFLDYSRTPSIDGFAHCELGRMIEKTCDLFAGGLYGSVQGDATRVTLECVPPEGSYKMLPQVLGNLEQLKQVLTNLIQNAMSAARAAHPRGGGVVKVGAFSRAKTDDGGLEVVVFVEDNGHGVERENMEKIFIPFFTTSPGGTGLGLAICSKIAAAHGGRIEVASEEGTYARFSLCLPAAGDKT